ncbi:hypothetical protein T03_7805 [Trichinella britovi]|uniref:Uncharacterized protein n=1 Tax=Trichinella britovi TaxID=45882 RepID=A0A0V1CJP6_TRIBR|nr:hypothetical protein T03_7805 [Trichinella britovi]
MAGYIKPQYKLRLLVKSTTFRVIMQKKAPDGSRSPVLQPKSGPPYICVVLTQWDYLLFDYIFSSDTQRFKPFHASVDKATSHQFKWLTVENCVSVGFCAVS